MFVVSLKTSRKKLLAISGAAFLLVTSFILYSNFNVPKSTYVMSSGNAIDTKANDNDSRKKFLLNFGWETGNEPIEVCQIVIPGKFNDTYLKYNDLQKSQGFNLEKYKGCTCKNFKYKITNYGENHKDDVVANLIIYKNKIIGGDISSVELSGFMHGFKKDGTN